LARAKRTDRTEARRRHRAELAAQATEPDLDEPLAPNLLANDALAKPRSASKATDAPARPSITAAFRTSFHPVDLRGDLLALPRVLTHWAFLAAVAVSVVATAVFIATASQLGAALDFSLSDPFAGKTVEPVANVSYLVVSLFVVPPPAAGAFLVGFTARRASWLGGLAQGIVAAICYVAIVVSPAGRLLTGAHSTDPYILNAVALGPVGAMLFAAAAAWYRRFLNLANPNRGARRPVRSTGKPKARPAAARTGGRGR